MKLMKGIMIGLLVIFAGILTMGTANAEIYINEILPEPSTGDEWIELYNDGDSNVDLTGYSITDGIGQDLASLNGKTVPAGGFLSLTVTGNKLDNDGDIIELNDSVDIVDSVAYGTWDDGDTTDNAADPAEDESLARIPDGQDTDVDSDDFVALTSPTKGRVNSPSIAFDESVPADGSTITERSGTFRVAYAVGTTAYTFTYPAECGDPEIDEGTADFTCTADSDGEFKLDVTITDDNGNSDVTETRTYTVALTKAINIVETSVPVTKVASNTESTVEGIFNLNNTGEADLAGITATIGNLTLTYDSDEKILVSNIVLTPAVTSLAKGESTTVSYAITVPRHNDIDYFGTYGGTVTVNTTEGATDTVALNLQLRPKDFNQDLFVDKIEIDNDDLFRLESTEIDVTIRNDLSKKDVENIDVFLDIPEIDISEKESIDSISNKDEETVTFSIEVPDDAASGTYPIRIYVEGEDEDNNDMANFDNSEELSVEVDSDHVKVKSVTATPSSVACGQSATVTVDVTNIGTSKEKDLSVVLKSTDLGISQTKTLSELKSKKSHDFEYTIVAPIDKPNGIYLLSATVTYKDDSDQDEEDDLTESGSITLTGCAADGTPPATTPTTPTVGAAALSGTTTATGAQAGDVAKYLLTLTNNEDAVREYSISITGITDWATATVEPEGTIGLAAGQSIPLYVYLTSSEDASGDNTATVSVYSGTSLVTSTTLTTQLPEAPAAAGTGDATVTTFTQAITGATVGAADWDIEEVLGVLAAAAVIVVMVGAMAIALRDGRTRPRNGRRRKRVYTRRGRKR